jgi:hypothetical protein
VLADIIKKEARIGIKEKDVTKLADKAHPEYNKFFGPGSLMEMITRKKYSPAQIIEKGADELLEEFAKTKGWDQERLASIEKKAKQTLLQSLKGFKKEARMLDVGKKPVSESAGSGQSFDRQTLIAELVSGKADNWSKLISRYGDQGNQKMVTQLNEIFDIAERQRQQG